MIKKKRFTKEGTALFLIAIPFMVYIFAFSYVMLFGWGYAFVDFRPAFGPNPFDHEFVGLKNFVAIFAERNEIIRALRNTLVMSVLGLAMSPLSVGLAILFMEIRGRVTKRVLQTITTFPNFISWIIIYGIAFTFFESSGVFNAFLEFIGLNRVPNVMGNVDVAWTFQTGLSVWKGIGWGAIIYVAAISGIDESLYEAARIDGANKLMCIRHITIPGIAETFLVLLLLAIGNILSNDFDKLFIFNNPQVTQKLMNIDLYVFRVGITQMQHSFAIAVGITKTLVALILIFSMNRLAKHIRGETMI